MKIIGLLNWYEENPAWLAECVASVARLCDHLIAVDGPYFGFPGAHQKPYSCTEQADAILRTAAGAGMGCTIHQARKVWSGKWGGEVAKRDFMFQLGMTFALDEDWFFRIDADEVLTDVPMDTKLMLKHSEYDVAEVTLWERESSDHIGEVVDTRGDYHQPLRCLFRALPDIHIEQTHYTVKAGDKTLNGLNQVPADPLWDVRLEHRTRLRTKARWRLKNEYNKLINDFEKVEDVFRENPDA